MKTLTTLLNSCFAVHSAVDIEADIAKEVYVDNLKALSDFEVVVMLGLGHYHTRPVKIQKRGNKSVIINMNKIWHNARLVVDTKKLEEEVNCRIKPYTDLGLGRETGLYLLSKHSPKIVEIPEGEYPVKQCSGTYFGSGHVSYGYTTNSSIYEDGGEVDNGFCVIKHGVVTLKKGDWLYTYGSSNPGGSNFEKVVIAR